MSVSINAVGMFPTGKQQSAYPYHANQKQMEKADASQMSVSRKLKEDKDNLDEFDEPLVRKLVEQSRKNYARGQENVKSIWNYGDVLKACRGKSQQDALQVKQLQYNFKAISTKIVQSKNSVSARNVAREASREVIRLKRLKGRDDYDPDELQFAIEHAKKMERVAKKKVSHLEEEEMLKAPSHFRMGDSSEEEEEKELQNLEEDAVETSDVENNTNRDSVMPMPELQSAEDITPAYRSVQELLQDEGSALSEGIEKLEETVEDVAEELKSLLEDMGIYELPSMEEEEDDPADFKLRKIKHRNSEMKDIAKADGEYMKDLFERMEEKSSSADVAATGAATSFTGGMGAFSGASAGGFEAFV